MSSKISFVCYVLTETPVLISHFLAGSSLTPCRGNGGNDANSVVIKT